MELVQSLLKGLYPSTLVWFLTKILPWLKDNWGNIVAGIVASVIVLVLQTAVRTASLAIAALLTLKWRLRLLWGLRQPRRVYVVSGAIVGVAESVKSVVIAGPDAEAASALIATAGLLYPDAEIKHVYSSSFPLESCKEHLVVVGGPVNNSCSAAILHRLHDELRFQDFDLVTSAMTYETSYDAGGSAVKDHGAVVCLENPFDKTKDVVVIVGCDTHGVLAATTMLTTRPEGKEVRAALQKRLGWGRYFFRQEYIAVVQCDVLGNDIGVVNLVEVHKVKFK